MKGEETTRGKRRVKKKKKKKSRAGDKSINYDFSSLHNRIIRGKKRTGGDEDGERGAEIRSSLMLSRLSDVHILHFIT